jgi:hypothetical protein
LGLYFNLDRADAIEEHLRQRISKDDAAVFDLPREEFGKAMEEKIRESRVFSREIIEGGIRNTSL